MLAYEKRLQADCEKWFKVNYCDLCKNFKVINIEQAYRMDSYNCKDWENWPTFSPGYQLIISMGPWKSLYIKFKQPGESLSSDEKFALNQLRDQNHRVAIVRYFEDFKTLINSYVVQAIV